MIWEPENGEGEGEVLEDQVNCPRYGGGGRIDKQRAMSRLAAAATAAGVEGRGSRVEGEGSAGCRTIDTALGFPAEPGNAQADE